MNELMNNKSLLEKIEFWSGEFEKIKDWEGRYKKIIELGKNSPGLPEDMQTDASKIKGCQSQVWLHAKLHDGRVFYQGDSDAVLVKGLVSLLLQIYSGSTPMEVLQTPPDFLKKFGFETHLSPSRASGFVAMIKQIRLFAYAFQTQMG